MFQYHAVGDSVVCDRCLRCTKQTDVLLALLNINCEFRMDLKRSTHLTKKVTRIQNWLFEENDSVFTPDLCRFLISCD